eukprot:3187868-Rhodomonas_salina.1
MNSKRLDPLTLLSLGNCKANQAVVGVLSPLLALNMMLAPAYMQRNLSIGGRCQLQAWPFAAGWKTQHFKLEDFECRGSAATVLTPAQPVKVAH